MFASNTKNSSAGPLKLAALKERKIRTMDEEGPYYRVLTYFLGLFKMIRESDSQIIALPKQTSDPTFKREPLPRVDRQASDPTPLTLPKFASVRTSGWTAAVSASASPLRQNSVAMAALKGNPVRNA